jgi:hypothetical protein
VVQIKAQIKAQKDNLLPIDDWWFHQTVRFRGRDSLSSGPLKRAQKARDHISPGYPGKTCPNIVVFLHLSYK